MDPRAPSMLAIGKLSKLDDLPPAPWHLDLGDDRYPWPESFAVAYAARCVAAWRVGAVPLFAQADPAVFRVGGRLWRRLSMADICTVIATTIHADRMLNRLPQAIVRTRHAHDIEMLTDVGRTWPQVASVADVVGLGFVEEHAEDIGVLSALLDTHGAMQAEDLGLFAVARDLLHRTRPVLLLATAAIDDNNRPKESP